MPITMDINEYVKRLGEGFPEDAAGIARFFLDYGKIVLWMLEPAGKDSGQAKAIHLLGNLGTAIRFLRMMGNLGGSHLGWKTTAKTVQKNRVPNSTPLSTVLATG